ncbi:hypothetical protein EW146_g5896 [Bondarzewia mesenterica]|uniref:galacturonan 1,4-alpha-galacturonidase n=1 Tax=Bondarzewia mesenterica TaxID=1095465 RepID=A0A4S4LS62_9AGAM|nr:hypothetical protein EW146_g5896 [Bondarzewia mesenterica]
MHGGIVCILFAAALFVAAVDRVLAVPSTFARECTLRPLGPGKDDTAQVKAAIAACGKGGRTTFDPGEYNITSKMTWNLVESRVDMHGYLNFQPDIQYWLNASNTYRVVFIQSQASWFVITGREFEVDAHNEGGINGNGQVNRFLGISSALLRCLIDKLYLPRAQPWWSYYANRTREDGDGRPISFTLSNARNARISNFQVIAPPFWCNAVADSEDVVYDGMKCNATNTDPAGAGKNLVPNTDGIDTYRSNRLTLNNWDVTCGDDCLAVKGNTTNLKVNNVTCRGGNGIAFGSLGQYVDLRDLARYRGERVHAEPKGTIAVLKSYHEIMIRLDPEVQPNMQSGVYFKSWTGTVNGVPPTGGGGGGGRVSNVVLRNVSLDRVALPTQIYQTNGGHSTDAPSKLQFSNIIWVVWTGTSTGDRLVSLSCSPAAPCPDMFFQSFDVTPPNNGTAQYVCSNVVNEQGLPGPAVRFLSMLDVTDVTVPTDCS